MSSRLPTKEGLLGQVDALRDIARRSRRLSETMELESDQRHLTAHVEWIEDCARRVEKRAIEAKTFLIVPSAEQKKSDGLA
jgi:hypothetical protein